MHQVRRALRSGQHRGQGTAVQVYLVLLLRHGVGGQRHCGVPDLADRVHPTPVEPLAHDAAGDVGLVLVIGDDHLDGDVRVVGSELRYRLADTGRARRTLNVTVGPGHVGEGAKANRRLAR